MKYRQLYRARARRTTRGATNTRVELPDGTTQEMTNAESQDQAQHPTVRASSAMTT